MLDWVTPVGSDVASGFSFEESCHRFFKKKKKRPKIAHFENQENLPRASLELALLPVPQFIKHDNISVMPQI